MLTVKRYSYDNAPKTWEEWQNTTPKERLFALQRLRRLAFVLANQGNPLPDCETLRTHFREFF